MIIRRRHRTIEAAVVAAAAIVAAAAAIFVWRWSHSPVRVVAAPQAAAPQAVAQPQAPPAFLATRALFQYRRDDAAPGRLTRIHINAARGAAAPIRQNIFGNFLEFLGGTIYENVWAQALLNPNLERIEQGNTVPPAWDLSGGATWIEGGYLSPRCVRVAGDGALSQRIFLPVHRTRNYTVTLHARAATGGGQINIALRAGGNAAGDGAAGPSVAQGSLRVAGDGWQKQALRWQLPAGGLAKGQEARFVVTSANPTGSQATVDVDQIEIFPDDAVNGLDPDVLRAARAWRIPILRLSGNFSSGYHWRDGIGPRALRPTSRNPAWGNIEPNHFGTDEFLDFARRIGAVPQIGVNAGNGTPEEAAAWVRYANRNALQVPLWEIGNELYGGWQIGHTDAAGNAARFVRFRAAMLQADPRIQIIATGKGDEFSLDGLERSAHWNEAVLRAAIADGGASPEYLSIHPLVGLPANLRPFSFAEQYESAMSHPEFLDRSLLPSLVQSVRKVQGPAPRTRIAVTEWGIIVGGDRWWEGPNHDALSGAIFNALTLNAMLRHSDWVTLANMTALTHGGGIKKPRGVVIVDPQYYTQQLYAAAAPRIPLQTTWSGPGRDVPARGFLPAAPDVPDVDVFSALNADRTRLVAFAINRSLNEARPVRLTINGFEADQVAATILTAPDVKASNTWDRPHAVAPRRFALPPGRERNIWTASLPPHSLVVFTFRRAGAKARR